MVSRVCSLLNSVMEMRKGKVMKWKSVSRAASSGLSSTSPKPPNRPAALEMSEVRKLFAVWYMSSMMSSSTAFSTFLYFWKPR